MKLDYTKIKRIIISEEQYNEFLEAYPRTEIVENVFEHEFSKFYKKNKICIADGKRLVTTQWYLEYILHIDFDDSRNYRHILCTIDYNKEDNKAEGDVCGSYAKAYINKILYNKGFTKKTLSERLNKFSLTKEEHEKQLHRNNYSDGHICKFDNCYYYDINKAHSEALSIIFPEIKDALVYLAKRSKENPKLKKIPNYYVGMLAYRGDLTHVGTYYWIVDYVTKKLSKFINELTGDGSRIIYLNTDGVIIQNPAKVVPGSSEFGKFKLEYQGTVYATQNEGGWMIQYGDEIKSCIKYTNRIGADLSKGIAVRQYDNKTKFELINKEIKNYE